MQRIVSWKLTMVLFQLLVVPVIQAIDASPLDTFLSFVTNCPPIYNMVLDFQEGRDQMRFQFRYQQDAFFFRQFSSTNEMGDSLSLEDSMCGRWGDDYWYYDPQRRLRYEYHYSTNDTLSSGYMGQFTFKVVLGLFQSSGSSDQGLNSLSWDGKRLFFTDQSIPCTNYLTLRIQNGLPVGAFGDRILMADKKRIVISTQYDWTYDTNIAPIGIPVRINLNKKTWRWIRVLTFALGNETNSLLREDCFPSFLFTNQTVSRVVHSNRIDYMVNKGAMLSMNVAREEELAKQQSKRNTFLFTLVLFIILLVPVFLAFSKRKKTINK